MKLLAVTSLSLIVALATSVAKVDWTWDWCSQEVTVSGKDPNFTGELSLIRSIAV